MVNKKYYRLIIQDLRLYSFEKLQRALFKIKRADYELFYYISLNCYFGGRDLFEFIKSSSKIYNNELLHVLNWDLLFENEQYDLINNNFLKSDSLNYAYTSANIIVNFTHIHINNYSYPIFSPYITHIYKIYYGKYKTYTFKYNRQTKSYECENS